MFKLKHLRCVLLQKFYHLQKLQIANVAYQFKVERKFYYPDRHLEMERINEQLKSQLVAETQEKKKLPKDYYYKILSVRKNATTQQIKAAYYALAKRFHPDASNTPQQTKRFQEVSNAYHILTDDNKRLEYDQLGVVKNENAFLHKANMTADTINKDETPDKAREEIMLITNRVPRLELTFLEAAHGLKKTLDLRFLKKCPSCNGKSPKLVGRSDSELCRKCGGKGEISKKTPTYSSVSICDMCQGKRYTNRHQCETCDNRGIVSENTRVIVPVPSGIKTGEIVTIENPKTKKYVNYQIIVKESDYYQRIGNDVCTDRYMSISDAVLGATHKVRGIYEDIEVKIQPATESHTKLIIKGKGIRSREGVGDHVITLKIHIPRQMTMKQRQLILALAKTEDPTFQNPS